jgi:hypothetical protein
VEPGIEADSPAGEALKTSSRTGGTLQHRHIHASSGKDKGAFQATQPASYDYHPFHPGKLHI